MPRLLAGLSNLDSAGTGREQPLQLVVLVPVGGTHIDVQTQLSGLGLVSLAEDDRGLRAAEADARRPDLDVCPDAFQLDIAQYLAPEPRQQFGITCVQDQFGDATCHLITISLVREKCAPAGNSPRDARGGECGGHGAEGVFNGATGLLGVIEHVEPVPTMRHIHDGEPCLADASSRDERVDRFRDR